MIKPIELQDGTDLVELTNAVNELISAVNKQEEKIDSIISAIKCLKNDIGFNNKRIDFIMEKTPIEIFTQTGMEEADSEWKTLQDLWDEQKSLEKLDKDILGIEPTIKCMCSEQKMLGEADVEINGVCHRLLFPCFIKPTVKEQYCEEAFTKADKINSVKLNIDCPKCHKHIEADVPAFRLEVTHPNYKEPTVKSNVAEVLDAYVNSVPSFKKKPKKYSLWGRKKDAIDYTQPTDKD